MPKKNYFISKDAYCNTSTIILSISSQERNMEVGSIKIFQRKKYQVSHYYYIP